ncbi:MAG: SDR family oxidoreductase [Candidatus Thorarchaeota archaeon]
MKDKVCIVTGSNSGIGKETARALATMDATVIMVVRNQERGEVAKSDIIESTGNDSIDLMLCDLSSMGEIRRFAQEFSNQYDRLDVLINNAGAVVAKRQVTQEGHEITLAVNYLAPFLMTHELLPLLQSSAPSRVINLSSGLHKSAKFDIDDLQSEDKYKSRSVYGTAKLLVVMHTYEFARRLNGTGITVNVSHPGFVATNLGANTGSRLSSFMFKFMKPFQKSAPEGAETSVYLASSPELEGVTGRYFAKKQEVSSSGLSYDQDHQQRLWERTVEMLGIQDKI